MDIFENFILQKQPSVITKNKQIKAFVAEKHLLQKRLKRKMLNSNLIIKLTTLQANLQS